LREAKAKVKEFASQFDVELSFSGGEPTIWRKDLLYLIAYAKKKGIKRIQIQTNATLITKDYAEDLKSVGLTNAFVSFHSHIKKVNDKLTGLENSYDMTLRGIENLIFAHVGVTINTVINKLNYKHFHGFVAFVKERFRDVKLISLAVMQPVGMAEKNIHLLLRYSEIKPYIAKGISLARENNIRIDNHYCGLPLCFWDKDNLAESIEYNENRFLRRKENSFTPDKKVMRVQDGKVQTSHCFNCYLKNFCNGVWKAYVDRYGPSDVKPVKESLKWWF
jgi:MoaA/NifB/PqqE/SkfB family radical SAM enzyme